MCEIDLLTDNNMNFTNPTKPAAPPVLAPQAKKSLKDWPMTLDLTEVIAADDAMWAARMADPSYPKTKLDWPE